VAFNSADGLKRKFRNTQRRGGDININIIGAKNVNFGDLRNGGVYNGNRNYNGYNQVRDYTGAINAGGQGNFNSGGV
jgi:hypothetical protein